MEGNRRTAMSATQGKYTLDEICDRGEAIFFGTIQPKLGPEWDDQFVAIDIESGDYEIGRDELALVEVMQNRKPDGTLFLARAGAKTAHTIGSSR
jgi:hypothetical protein